LTGARTGSTLLGFIGSGTGSITVALISLRGDIETLSLALTVDNSITGVSVTPESFNAFASFFLANGYVVNFRNNFDGTGGVRVTIDGENLDAPIEFDAMNSDNNNTCPF